MNLPNISNGIGRDQLRLRANRAAAELRSKGTIEDPVAGSLGWSTDRLDAFDSTLESYPNGNIDELKSVTKQRRRTGAQTMVDGFTGALLAGSALVGIAAATPLVGIAAATLGVGAAAGLGAYSLLKGIAGKTYLNQAKQTAADLDKWEQAYQKNDTNLGTLSDEGIGFQIADPKLGNMSTGQLASQVRSEQQSSRNIQSQGHHDKIMSMILTQ